MEELLSAKTIVTGLVTGFILWRAQRLLNATEENTIKVAVLTAKLDEIIKNQEKVSKLEKDLNALHEWKRNNKGDMDGPKV